MNTNIENILIKTLEKAQVVGGNIYDATKSGIEKAVDFAKEQIPDIIQQIMLWEFWYHAVRALIWIFIVGIILYFVRKYWMKALERTKRGDPFILLNGFGIFVSVLIFLAAIIPNIQTCVKIGVAPKLFMIEYCSDLISHRSNPDFRDHNH